VSGVDRSRPPALVLDGVSVARGGQTVWSEGTFTVHAGAVVGVIGPNGAGKTTMFQVALGLLPVTAGTVEVLGAPPRRGNRRIGYVPQNYTAALGEAIRARDLVTLGLTGGRFGLRRTTPAERVRVDQALAWVGADDYAERSMSELSGGQQQRVAIARALCMNPRIMLFDEPTSALDPEMVKEVLDTIISLAGDGMTMICVSHEMGFARRLANRVIFMDGGRIVEVNEPNAFFDTPQHERTRLFLSQMLH
jgi:zinc/manganese transport system ATP-binding protein